MPMAMLAGDGIGPEIMAAAQRVLAALARSVFDEKARDALLEAKTLEDAVRCLDEHGRRIANEQPGPRMASLTDM